MQSAGDRDLLRIGLAFADRKIRTDIDLESVQWTDCEQGIFGVANFFQPEDVRRELSDVMLNRANLPCLLGSCRVRSSSGEPLNIPKCGGDGGSELAWGRESARGAVPLET